MSARQNQINFRKKLKKAGYRIISFKKLCEKNFDVYGPAVVWCSRRGKMLRPKEFMKSIQDTVEKQTITVAKIMREMAKNIKNFKWPENPLKELEDNMRTLCGLPKVEVTDGDNCTAHVTITCPNCEPWKSVFEEMEKEEQQKASA